MNPSGHISDLSVTKQETIYIADDETMVTEVEELKDAKQTSDKGADANNVATGSISNVIDKTVPGVGSVPDSEITFNVDITEDGNVDIIMSNIGKNKWFFETLDFGQAKIGVLWYGRIDNIQITGQSLNNMKEFNMRYTLMSDEYYYVREDGSKQGLTTGIVVPANKSVIDGSNIPI